MKDPAIEIWAEDEVHFQRTSSLIRTWAPIGEQPRVLSPATKQKIGFFGAISLKTGQLLTQEDSVFNTETFRNFLFYLVNSTDKCILLILDRASYHRAKRLKPFLEEYRTRLTLVFLPPYSPELNPTERVWRITRRKVTHNRYFPEIKDLRQSLVNQFAQWRQPNETLRVLCANI